MNLFHTPKYTPKNHAHSLRFGMFLWFDTGRFLELTRLSTSHIIQRDVITEDNAVPFLHFIPSNLFLDIKSCIYQKIVWSKLRHTAFNS